VETVTPTPRRAGRRPTPSTAVLTCGLLVTLTLAVLASLSFGSRSIPLSEVFSAVFTQVDSDNATVITSQRVPRTLIGILAGIALGVAGALMQGHTRNPLADPGLFGVNAGAGFAVVLVAFSTGISDPTIQVAAAMAGAAGVTVLVFVAGLGSMRGGALVMVAILGTTASALFVSLTTALTLLDSDALDASRFWEAGSINNRDTALLWVIVPMIVIGLVLSVTNGFALDALSLGDDVAQALGHDVRRTRIIGIAAITLLAGPVTALCGPIGFLGLVAPHAARLLTGHDYRRLVPFAGIIGAVLILVSDTIGRLVAFHGELEAGIVMSIIGAPILIGLTRRKRMVSL